MKFPATGRGFTLLEVLIAMAIIAIALLAAGKNSRQQLRQVEALRQTTLASWVADNVVTEARLGLDPLAPGTSTGRRRMGNQDWEWTLNVSPSPDPAVWRLDAVVRAAAGPATTNLLHTGFARADTE